MMPTYGTCSTCGYGEAELHPHGCIVCAENKIVELKKTRTIIGFDGDGDRESQASAWRHIWQGLWDAGMASFVEFESVGGLGRAMAFVKKQAAEVTRLREMLGIAVRELQLHGPKYQHATTAEIMERLKTG